MNTTIIRLLTALIPFKSKRKKYRNLLLTLNPPKTKLSLNSIKTAQEWTIDVKAMPKAGGISRIIQLLELDILVEIDRICRKHGLRYWLDFGTLLGAVRHKGFIPWDDDMDISMPYADFIKFQEIAKTELKEQYILSSPPGMITCVYNALFSASDKSRSEQNGKREKAYFQVDIFPVHYLKDEWDFNEACKYIKKAITKKCIKWDFDYNKIEEYGKYVHEKLEAPLISDTESERMFMSIDCHVQPKPNIYRTKDIFPLREIEFEGKLFFAPHNTEVWLTYAFGEYWKPVILPSHNNIKELSLDEVETLVNWGKEHGFEG